MQHNVTVIFTIVMVTCQFCFDPTLVYCHIFDLCNSITQLQMGKHIVAGNLSGK